MAPVAWSHSARRIRKRRRSFKDCCRRPTRWLLLETGLRGWCNKKYTSAPKCGSTWLFFRNPLRPAGTITRQRAVGSTPNNQGSDPLLSCCRPLCSRAAASYSGQERRFPRWRSVLSTTSKPLDSRAAGLSARRSRKRISSCRSSASSGVKAPLKSSSSKCCNTPGRRAQTRGVSHRGTAVKSSRMFRCVNTIHWLDHPLRVMQ